MALEISGKIVDVVKREIYNGKLIIEGGIIKDVLTSNEEYPDFILPGFIDSHIHIESSMLVPSEFARLAVKFGTVATVSDPHEIANVLGLWGIEFMINNGNSIPLKFFWGASSCVPATDFETTGATLNADDIRILFEKYQLRYLSEMMNYPGVIYNDEKVYEKLNVAKSFKLPIDGHSPGLRGENLKKYISAGISTDHECFSLNEALEKLNLGMKILIREGSAAKNYEELKSLIKTHPESVMFCADDLHPDDLLQGHINLLIKRALNDGFDLFDVLRCCSYNPVKHYNLNVGLLQKGDPADFITVRDLNNLEVITTYIDGVCVYKNPIVSMPKVKVELVNKFYAEYKTPDDFVLPANSNLIRVIEAIDGELITNETIEIATIASDTVISDPSRDILKLTVVNRYLDTKPAIAFIKNFGIKNGAIASSVAHDSHNIIAVGTSDHYLASAVNLIIEYKGGLCFYSDNEKEILPLPIAGIMTDEEAHKIAAKYHRLNELAHKAGCHLRAPFMTLSFMSLLVIPKLKLSDRGLFDGETLKFVSVFI
ncbi:MAG: adenine deaminase [Ignavibacteria bacterium]